MMPPCHPRSCLLVASLLALGCSSNKPKTGADEETKDKSPSTETAKVVAAPPKAPTPVRPLPQDTGEHGGTLRFAVSHGSTDTDSARALAIDSHGDYLVCGYFKGDGIFEGEYSTEDSNAFVAKLSGKDGSVVWSKELGGTSADSCETLALAPDGSSIIAGSLSGEFQVGDGTLTSAGADDIFIAKFSADGRRLWVKRIGADNIDAAHAIIVDATGNAYVTGVFRSKVTFGDEELPSAGDADIFLTKLSPTGDFVWTKTFGAIGQDFGRDIAIDSEGNLVLLAEISNQVDLGGGALTTNGNRDIVLAKFDASGAHIWSKSMGNNFDDLAIGLSLDSSDNILFTGSFEDTVNLGGEDLVAAGRSDMFVAKYDPNGNHVWTTGFGGKDKDWGNSIASDSFGNSYVTGWFWFDVDFGGIKLKSHGKEDAFLMKLSPQGSVLWAKSFGGDSLDMGKVVAVDAKGGVVTVGAYNQEIDLGAGTLKPLPGKDPKILKGDFYLAAFER